jgi:primosomal protein N' (replication factor Y)
MSNLFGTQVYVGYARVAVERGVDRYPDGLTYGIPAELAGIAPGERVIVPLGPADTSTAGYVVEVSNKVDLDPARIKSIAARDRSGSRLPFQLLELARWISSYYCCPIGMTLASMLPAAVKRSVGTVTRTMIDLGDPLPLDGKLPPKQRKVLEAVAALPGDRRPIELRELAAMVELKTTGPIKALIDRGLLEASHRTLVEAVWSRQAIDTTIPRELTEAQRQIIDDVGSQLGHGFSAHLLFGVTGSGKTEVYIRLIDRVLATGRSALMLVPEISLTPQTGGRLIGRFPNHRVAVLHSGLTAAQRHQQWSLASRGEAPIVLGARSAVFAPIPDDSLGLIIVDEEHDGSYKQDQAPRYHGRDIAVRRAQLAGCTVLLGSATPSLESWFNATERKTYRLHRLAQRVPGMRLPQVKIVDFIEQRKIRHDRGVHLIGPILERAIDESLQAGGQILLMLNRRGYANYIACPDHNCGWMMTCEHCDATVVYHLHKKIPQGGFVRCHHCLAEQKLPQLCPLCGKHVSVFGLGTQRVEEELARKFPALIEGQTMLRVDSDSMHSSKDFHDALGRFARGELRMLIGTQMIAKGLDFPGVRLVGVINADTAINLPDFRASERTFQLVAQVAGRCGRGTAPGQVIVQTFSPNAPAIALAAQHDFETFARSELAERSRSKLPPVARMARLIVRDVDLAAALARARELAAQLRDLADRSIHLRGPAPCPIARIADHYRQQIELLAPSPAPLQELLAKARNAGLLKPGADLAVDVDPIALL